ncbi:hypothetical protein ACLB1O_07835 [Escherichia coli]
MNIFDHYRQRYEAAKDEEFTLQEFTTCRQDRSAYANAAERLLIAIGQPVHGRCSPGTQTYDSFFTRVIARYPAFEEFYGMEDAIEQIVSYLKPQLGLEEKKPILYLLGPVGGGKSSLAERLKSLMQLVPIYVLSANGERSPVNNTSVLSFQSAGRCADSGKRVWHSSPLSRHHHVAVGGKTPA